VSDDFYNKIGTELPTSALQQFRQLSEGIAEVPGNRVNPLWRGGVPNRQAPLPSKMLLLGPPIYRA